MAKDSISLTEMADAMADRAHSRKSRFSAATLERYRLDPVEYAEEELKIETLTPVCKDILRSLVIPPYRTLVKSGHNVGKCVAVGEKLTLADGSRVLVEDLVGTDFELLTLVNGQPEPVGACAGWNRREPVFRITTETGKTIVRNAAHPLWSAKAIFGPGQRPRMIGKGWRSICQIEAGDVVAVPECLPAFGIDDMPEHDVKVMAYLIGDGGMTGSNIRFTQLDNRQLAEFRESCRMMKTVLRQVRGDPISYTIAADGSLPKETRRTSSGRTNTFAVNPVRRLMGRHGLLGKHSRDKFVPEAIFTLKKRLVSLFLSRLYATDGWASLASNGVTEVGFCSVSERLCRDVQELLLRFGVHGRIRYRENVNAWCVEVHSGEAIQTFHREIGIYGKEDALENVIRASRVRNRDGRRWKTNPSRKPHFPPAGTRWEKVEKVEELPARMTVAIEVPLHHTYLTHFYEHNTHILAVAVNYRYDCFDPGAVISTAPSERDVKDLLWAEIRTQRQHAGLPTTFIGDVAPEMRTSVQHYAKGYTARGGVSFVGRHPEYLFFGFDEASGIRAEFWTTTETMFKSDPKHGWMAILNPTDVTSIAYQEEHKGEWVGDDGLPAQPEDANAVWRPKWNVFTMSALDHPNITGIGPQIKAAVSRSQVDVWVKDWCDSLRQNDERVATDLEWPVGSGRWWRPGPEFQSRVLGQWPSEGTRSVWTDSLWEACAKPVLVADFPLDEWPEIGVDLGNTSGVTSLHGRWGKYSVHHLEANGWSGPRKKGEIIQLCRELADRVNRALELAGKQTRCMPTEIRIKIDDAVGGRDLVGHLQEQGYNAVDINASTTEGVDLRKYPKMRSQLWFQTVKKGDAGLVKFGLLPKRQIVELKLQAMAPEWQLDGAGRRVVEEKPKTEERLGRSPDGMDSANLAFLDTNFVAPSPIEVQRLTVMERFEQAQTEDRTTEQRFGSMFGGRGRRGIFGQGR